MALSPETARAEETAATLRRVGVAAQVRNGRVTLPASEVPRAFDALCDRVGASSELPPALRDRPLLATEPEVRARREHALGLTLAATLRELPGVRAARVLVSLPPPPPLDQDLAAHPRALVSLAVDRAAPVEVSRVQGLVAAAVDGMRADDVRVDLRPAHPAPPATVAWVGPFAVYPSSAGRLRATLLALLATNALLAGILLHRARPWRRA